MVTGVGEYGQGEGVGWELGTDMYILQHLKQITNKGLPYKHRKGYSVSSNSLNGKRI